MRVSAATVGRRRHPVPRRDRGPGWSGRPPDGHLTRPPRRRSPAHPNGRGSWSSSASISSGATTSSGYGARWTSGLARLVKEGAVFDRAAYPYFHTITCAGHATMSTGVYPATHGLALNAFWDRGERPRDGLHRRRRRQGHRSSRRPQGADRRAQRPLAARADLRRRAAPAVDADAPGRVDVDEAARRDQLAGQGGDAVLWYTPEGGPTTSTAYAGSAIPFANKFAQANPTPAELTGEWKKLLPEDAYQNEDDGSASTRPRDATSAFPHPLTQTRTDGRVMSYWQSTPAADAFLARLAIAAVDELKLGKRAPRLPGGSASRSSIPPAMGSGPTATRCRMSCCAWIGRSASCSTTSTRKSARAATWWRSPGITASPRCPSAARTTARRAAA